MRFFVNKAVLLFLATLAIADERCTNGPFVKDPPKAGVEPPNPGCHTQWDNGEVIVGIEAWAAKFQMKAIRFKYSQMGWGAIHGTVDKYADTHAVGEWKATDQVSTLDMRDNMHEWTIKLICAADIRMWNNKPDDGDPVDAVGRILITDQGGRTLLDVGANSKKTAKTENYGANMGGGIILAARAGAGAWLDYLEFNMLKSKVKSAELIEVNMSDKLEDVNKKQQGIKDITLTTMYFINANDIGGSNMIYGQHMEDRKRTESSITTETTNEWTTGVSITVGASVGIPLLSANVETTTSVGYTSTEFESNTLTEEGEKTFKWDFRCDPKTPLPPQRAAKCIAKSTSGDFDGSYIGTVQVELVDGSTYKYKEKGEVKTLSYTDARASCQEIDIDDVPSDAEVGDTEEVDGKDRKVQRSRIFRM